MDLDAYLAGIAELYAAEVLGTSLPLAGVECIARSQIQARVVSTARI
jgi:hypothetical protein